MLFLTLLLSLSKQVKAEHTYMQWSLYFKTTCGILKKWSYIAGGFKMKVQLHHKGNLGIIVSGLITNITKVVVK